MRAVRTPELPASREWVYFLEAATNPIVVRIAAAPNLEWRLVTAQSMSPVVLKLTGLISAPAGTCHAIWKKFAAICTHAHWHLLTTPLQDFITALPRGEPIDDTLARGWADETGTTLKARRVKCEPTISDPVSHFMSEVGL